MKLKWHTNSWEEFLLKSVFSYKYAWKVINYIERLIIRGHHSSVTAHTCTEVWEHHKLNIRNNFFSKIFSKVKQDFLIHTSMIRRVRMESDRLTIQQFWYFSYLKQRKKSSSNETIQFSDLHDKTQGLGRENVQKNDETSPVRAWLSVKKSVINPLHLSVHEPRYFKDMRAKNAVAKTTYLWYWWHLNL